MSWQIMVMKTAGPGSGSIVPLNDIDEDATVEELFERVDKDIAPPGAFGLVYATKNLDGFRKKKLKEVGIGTMSRVIIFHKVRGGRNPEQTAELEAAMAAQKTGLQPLSGWVTLSQEDCMITKCGPDDECSHAKLFCGHVISPQGLTGYALSIVQEGRYQINCSLCTKEWPFFVVKHVGCFTDTEKETIESKLAENYALKTMGVQKCPGCLSYCQRTNEKNLRVICPVCTKEKGGKLYEFCWSCLHLWNGSGSNCGNDSCDGSDIRNRVLKEFGEEVTIEYTNIKCPPIRACPSCGVLINHAQGCKQMQCTQCKVEFCFVCLKKKENGSWQCGGSFDKCTKAAIQQF